MKNKEQELNKKIYKNFEKILIEKEVTKGNLAELMGVSKETISYFLKKLKKGEGVNISTICKYATALNVDPEKFFK